MKPKYYTGLILIIFESIVSGIYTPIDLSWIILRLGLISVYLTAALVDTKESRNVIAWIPLATIALSLLSVDAKYKALEEEKLAKKVKGYNTEIVKPEKPKLADCKIQPMYARPKCESDNATLQLAHNASLEKHNEKKETSEANKQTATVELTFQEQIPIFIYVLFISGLSFISFASTPKVEKQIEKVESVIEQKDERHRIVSRIIAGRSNLSIAEELGIDRRKIARIKNELGQWQHKARPTDAQSTEKVVSIREIKRGA